jgi:two-component system, chemotaxis family, sensor kinase CheA
MASEADDIRADFLIEAGELVEGLSAQLVELEARPDDNQLLNAIFRAFHTVKGGAGFLELAPLVALCHAAEDVFNVLRSGQRGVDAPLMDAVLEVVDEVRSRMQALADGRKLKAAPKALVDRLHALARAEARAVPVAEVPAAAPPPAGEGDSISEDDFEALLDQLHGKGQAPKAVVSPPPAAAPAAVAEPAAPAKGAPEPASAKPPAAEPSIRVDTARLDTLMNLVGELVLVRNRLKALRGTADLPPSAARAVGELDFLTRSLQNAVMQVRMQPIGRVFSRVPRIARDVARGLGKQVNVQLVGEHTEIDKNLVEALADPLVHMVRNSVDHGIELPEQRQAAGKPAAGTLTLSADQQGDGIVIRVRDDGAGIDAEKIRRKAVEKGLLGLSEAAALSPEECLQLVFLPGFSTREAVSDLSGRGVGMDVVMTAIKGLGGSVHIDATPGQGTCVTLRLPLTLAILSALIVEADGRRYALPLAPVQDIFALDPEAVVRMERWDAVLLRRETLRLIDLDPLRGPIDTPRHVVVAQVGETRYGFVVRTVRGREEVVIKPLGPSLRGLAGVSGATVMPDGRLALILDFAGLVARDPRSSGSERASERAAGRVEHRHG